MIALQEEGRRLYVTGNTFQIKDQIKSAGGHWDGDRKQWWVGVGKREEMQKAIAAAAAGDAASSPEDVRVIGKAKYKNRSYYVVWAGRTKFGKESFKLITLDQKISFWADAAGVLWEKQYAEPRSLNGIYDYVQKLRNDPEARAEAEDRKAHSGDRPAPGGRCCNYCGSRYCEGAWGGLCEQD